MSENQYPLIDTQLELNTALDAMAGPLSLDTEFIRERTYYPQLCLLQISDANTAICVDCLSGVDLNQRREQLLDRAPVLMHSGRQDLEILWQHLGQLPKRLIDTQIAAGLLGMPPQIGYGELVETRLAVKLDKSNARRDWTVRPLPADALRYALDDVRYLLPLWEDLAEELQRLNRFAWFEEDCQRQLKPEQFDDPRQIFVKLKGLGRLTTEHQKKAYNLVQWRERHAQKLNRPRRWILSDRALLHVATEAPKTLEQLGKIPEVGSGLIRRQGNKLLAQLAGASEKSVVELPKPLSAGQRRQVKDLLQRVAETAKSLQIRTEVLATRGDLEALARGEKPHRLVSGWRGELLGETGLLASSGVN